ncbi:hypothetical protein [Sinorhizobium meliloti]|uniref:hypothetical protein n=1 Tax=Rhizobium meliloti TaxID=382 RepID=UPI0015A68F12|nr:hypothetical protein [Sinorhizobium meliloti]
MIVKPEKLQRPHLSLSDELSRDCASFLGFIDHADTPEQQIQLLTAALPLMSNKHANWPEKLKADGSRNVCAVSIPFIARVCDTEVSTKLVRVSGYCRKPRPISAIGHWARKWSGLRRMCASNPPQLCIVGVQWKR